MLFGLTTTKLNKLCYYNGERDDYDDDDNYDDDCGFGNWRPLRERSCPASRYRSVGSESVDLPVRGAQTSGIEARYS